VNQSTTTSCAILTQENFTLLSSNLSQYSSFSIDFGYDCRSVLKDVLKSFVILCDVHNSHKRVVGFDLDSCRRLVLISLSHAKHAYSINRPYTNLRSCFIEVHSLLSIEPIHVSLNCSS